MCPAVCSAASVLRPCAGSALASVAAAVVIGCAVYSVVVHTVLAAVVLPVVHGVAQLVLLRPSIAGALIAASHEH
jgi:Asp/Glu/hydantoin racemase